MTEFMQALEPFVYGAVLGYVWHPVWNLCKRIYQEARLAQQEWKKPNDNRND